MSRTTLVTGVDFVSLPTQDLERATDFYANVVGLDAGPALAGGRDTPAMGAEFETGTVTIALIVTERLGIEFSPHNVPIALHVDDVEASRAELESRGVTFLGETIDSGVCLQALFKDPDGNVLDLHHRYAPRRDGNPDEGLKTLPSLWPPPTAADPPAAERGEVGAGARQARSTSRASRSRA